MIFTLFSICLSIFLVSIEAKPSGYGGHGGVIGGNDVLGSDGVSGGFNGDALSVGGAIGGGRFEDSVSGLVGASGDFGEFGSVGSVGGAVGLGVGGAVGLGVGGVVGNGLNKYTLRGLSSNAYIVIPGYLHVARRRIIRRSYYQPKTY